MKFEDTRLPKHASIEKAFNDLVALDNGDKFTTRGVLIARLIAEESIDKDPDAIAAGLFVPYTIESGPLSFARTDVGPRASAMIESMFAIGALAMRNESAEPFYVQQDGATRAVILASSARMFEVAAVEMEQSIAAARKSGVKQDAQFLCAALEPLRSFTDMVTRVEKQELALVKHCQEAVERIENALHDPAVPAESKPAARHRGPQ